MCKEGEIVMYRVYIISTGKYDYMKSVNAVLEEIAGNVIVVI